MTALLEKKADSLARDEDGDIPINFVRRNKEIQDLLVDAMMQQKKS